MTEIVSLPQLPGTAQDADRSLVLRGTSLYLAPVTAGSAGGSGFRNRLINGNFQINQRQITGGVLSSQVYIADRWRTTSAATVSAADGVVTLTAGSIGQTIDSENFGLAGQSVTVSVGGSSATPLGFSISAYNGGSGSVTGVIAAGSGRRGASVTVPSSVTGAAILQFAPVSGAAVFTDVMLAAGPILDSVFEFRPAAVELSLCQRYYCSVFRAEGEAWFGNIVYWSIEFPATMRAIPTLGLGGADPRNITVLTVGTRQVASLTSGSAITDSRARVATVLTDTGLVNGTLCFLDGGFPFTFSAEL